MAAVNSNQLTSGFTLNHRMHYPVLVYISGTLTRPFCSIYGRPLSQKIIFSKPIRRLEPLERPAEEASSTADPARILEVTSFINAFLLVRF
jgi:hypothetical protein